MPKDVTVYYFATLREHTGCREESIPLKAPRMLSDFLEDLLQRHPRMEEDIKHAAVAVNFERVQPDSTRVEPGDEVALLPPFGGGARPGD